MEAKTKITQTSLAFLGTLFAVPGTVAILFGFLAATYEPPEVGILIPYLEKIGHAMTSMVLFVCGFAGLAIGLLFFWFFYKYKRRRQTELHNKDGDRDSVP